MRPRSPISASVSAMPGGDKLYHHLHHHDGLSVLGKLDEEVAAYKTWNKMDEVVGHCHRPNCDWVALRNLTGLKDVPPLQPNPELSGIGVILGFSITAYLTLALLVLHYITVHDYHRTSANGKEYINPVDRGILTFIRQRVLRWTPSRRFEYAMEKAVLILSDTQLVTGLAFLIAGFSQLDCGIPAYHWQMMVYVAWFSSFSFLSAMTFLEDYFQTNQSLRIIRVGFMLVLGSFPVAALLPTGSHNWLNLFPEGDGFYPGLSTKCYYEQMVTGRFNHRRGPKLWAMVVSIAVIGVSYIHCGIRLFDPTAEYTRKYFRTWPGSYLKRLLYVLERRAAPRGLRAAFWSVPYLSVFAGFASLRALYDIMESMLLEVFWLTFAIAWGTIKLWDTRASAVFNVNGEDVDEHAKVLEGDFWSFGQTLPLVLLLLPILSMAQAYLDNDAKAADAAHRAEMAQKQERERHLLAVQSKHFVPVHGEGNGPVSGGDEIVPDLPIPTLCFSKNCNQITSTPRDCTWSAPGCLTSSSCPQAVTSISSAVAHQGIYKAPALPQYPYRSFAGYAWYKDHIFLLILQILMVTCFILFLLTQLSNFLGLSLFLRSRLFVGWMLGIIPAALLLHLAFWYIAAWTAKALGVDGWLMDDGRQSTDDGLETRWAKGYSRTGYTVYWLLRMGLVCGLLVFTFFISVEVAGPDPLHSYL